jgi:transposase InsO family protein
LNKFNISTSFHTLKEAQTLIEKWRMEYNTFRPHSSLNNRTPSDYAGTELLRLEN